MENLIKELTEKFGRNISENDSELITAFSSYLFSAINTIKNSKSQFVKKDDASIAKTITSMTESIIDKPLIYKKRLLIKDESFDKIKEHSLKAWRLAEDRLNGKDPKIDFDIEKTADELFSLLKSVRDFNKDPAEALVSEGILDLNYLLDPDVKLYSLRIGRLIRAKNIKEKNSKDEER